MKKEITCLIFRASQSRGVTPQGSYYDRRISLGREIDGNWLTLPLIVMRIN